VRVHVVDEAALLISLHVHFLEKYHFSHSKIHGSFTTKVNIDVKIVENDSSKKSATHKILSYDE
jgi:hypothetical protein